MSKRYLMSDQTLFKNREAFEIDHMPEQFLYRETQLCELASNVEPGIHGARPINVICKGLPGTGKTTSVLRIFAEVEETTRKLVPVYVNCQKERTAYAVFARIFTKLYGHAPPRTGVSVSSVLDAIGKAMQDKKIVLVVCLDDANFLLYEKALGTVLNSLLRLHQDYPGARAGVIGTVSDLDVHLAAEIEPWVLSVFCPTEIPFPPYSEEEIRGILQERVREGLYPGVVSPGMLQSVIEQTVRSGDVRVGIALLKWSVRNAERAARCMVVAEDVSAADEYARAVHLSCTAHALNPGERRLLRDIAELSGEGGVLTSGALYDSIQDREKISYSAFFKRLRKLHNLRLVDLRLRKLHNLRLVDLQPRHGRGRTTEIVLRFRAERVKEACGQ